MARRRRLRALTGAVLLALLAGSACTGGGGEHSEGTGKDRKPKRTSSKPVEKLWAAKSSGSRILWATDDIVALRSSQEGSTTGFDPRSGKQRWKLALPKGATGLCDVSNRVNEQGVGGVVFATGDKGECTLAAAVNSRTGEVLWSKSLGKEKMRPESDIGVNGQTVSVSLECRERILRVKDGGAVAVVPPGAPETDNCAYKSVRSEKHISVRYAPTPKTRPFIALYDADTGEELWRRNPRGLEVEAPAITADDPVTLVGATREWVDGGDVRMQEMRTFDEKGKPGHLLMSRRSEEREAVRTFVQDGVLVHSSLKEKTQAFDLRTGKKLWSGTPDPAALVLGISDGTVVTGASVRSQLSLHGYDLREGTERYLGRVTDFNDTEGVRSEDMSSTVLHKQRLYTLVEGEGGAGARLVASSVRTRGAAGSAEPAAP